MATVDNAGSTTLKDLSCPSTGFCAAADAKRHIITSTNPVNEVSTWTSIHLDSADFLTSSFSAISCPSTALCVAASGREVTTSTNPTGGAGNWTGVVIDSDTSTVLNDLVCPSTSLCVAVGVGRIFTSTNPTGGAAAWSKTSINLTSEFRAVTCASTALCLAVDDDGNVWHSTNPAGGAVAWSPVAVGPGTGFNDISCATGLCVAIAPYPSFGLATTSNPTGGAAVWTTYPLESIGGWRVSCPSTNLCLAGGYYNGDYVAASANPLGGASTWAAATPDPEFNGDHYITAVSCISDSLCMIGDKLGRVSYGTPKTGEEESKEEEHPSNPGNTCTTNCSPTTQPSKPPTPVGKALIGSSALVVGGVAQLQAHCAAQEACSGTAKLIVKASAASASSKAKTVTLGSSHFNIPAGKNKPIKIRLTALGRQLVRNAGAKGLSVKLAGTGLTPRTIKLKPGKG
ncbi:MAG TPA: hypothetical protein VF081_03435 [Solirubrobacterales bacterium]